MSPNKSQQIDYQVNNFFKICEMEIQIGELIRQKAKEENKSIAGLASDIHTGRRNMYKIIENNDMLLSQLWKISTSLNYNFFQEFNPIVLKKEPLTKGSKKVGAEKKDSQEFTLKVEFKYHMEDADKLGTLILHLNSLGEQLGFNLV